MLTLELVCVHCKTYLKEYWHNHFDGLSKRKRALRDNRRTRSYRSYGMYFSKQKKWNKIYIRRDDPNYQRTLIHAQIWNESVKIDETSDSKRYKKSVKCINLITFFRLSHPFLAPSKRAPYIHQKRNTLDDIHI